LNAKSSSTSRAEERPTVVSSAPVDPIEEIARIRREAAANNADSYFASPKV